VDILEFERQSAQHWMAILGDGERVPRAVTHPPKAEGDHPPSDAAESELQYISAKEIIEATGLPAHRFTDRIERERKRIPHLLWSGACVFRWRPSCNGNWQTAYAVVLEPGVHIVEPEPQQDAPGRVLRWHELVREQDGERFDSVR
jgi:hypothetical protein